MDFMNGRLQAFLGPPGAAGAPDDLEQEIIDFIDQSEHTLDIAVQEIDNPRIAEAIDKAARRKRPGSDRFIRVRLVTEGDYLKEAKPVDPDKTVSLDTNRRHFLTFLRGAVDAKIDFNPKIFHHKFVIRDRGEAREAVLTGSTNFTGTGTHRNLNHVAIFHDIGVAAAYQSEFDQLRDGIFGARSPKLTTTDPLTLDIEGSEVQILFSPDNNPELRIVNEILKAKTSAYFMMFTFAQSTTIDDALITKLQAGNFEVVGVLDGGQSAHKWSPHKALMEAGARLRRERLPDNGKLHHKVIVLDDRTVIGGSFNYTGPANRYNDENLFLVRNPELAAFFKAEVKRVFDSQTLSADF